MDDTAFPLMTRRQFVEFVQRQTGIPLTYSRLMKDGATGRGPRPTAVFGRQYSSRRRVRPLWPVQ
jgi:hypothetical protein